MDMKIAAAKNDSEILDQVIVRLERIGKNKLQMLVVDVETQRLRLAERIEKK